MERIFLRLDEAVEPDERGVNDSSRGADGARCGVRGGTLGVVFSAGEPRNPGGRYRAERTGVSTEVLRLDSEVEFVVE